MRDIKAAQNALQGHCERRGIFCGYSRNGTGMPTARENGRRRGERGAERTSGRARSSAGRWAVPGAIWGGLPRSGHRKSPGRIRGGGYLKRRAALKSVASGSRSRNKTGMRSPPMLLYHICGELSRGFAPPSFSAFPLRFAPIGAPLLCGQFTVKFFCFLRALRFFGGSAARFSHCFRAGDSVDLCLYFCFLLPEHFKPHGFFLGVVAFTFHFFVYLLICICSGAS